MPIDQHPQGPFDVFLSYARLDNNPGDPQQGWVTALHQFIQASARLPGGSVPRVFFDTCDIRDYEDWRHRILGALRHSKVLLVCLSPAYFNSNNCRWEWEHFLQRQGKRNLQGEGESIQALRLVEFAESDAPDANWFASVRRGTTKDLSPWFVESPQILHVPGAAQAVALEVVAALAKRIANARANLAREYGNLRAANSHFVGRKTQLQKLHEAVRLGKLGIITALHGLGGIGKTELAVQYANEYARSFSGGIWWIDAAPFSSLAQKANSPELLKHAIAHLADKLETSPPKLADNANAHFDYVIRTLRSDSERQRLTDPDGTSQVLILLDNVDDTALLGANQRNLIGNCSWLSLLATTRNASEEWHSADDLKVITLDGLDPDDALALMREWQNGHVFRDKADEDAARSLVESLGYYTLAVEQAAIYVGLKPEISIAEFLARLRNKGLAELDTLAAREPQLRSTIQHQGKQLRLVLEQTLPEAGTLARQILSYAALFDPDAIAKPWLETLIAEHHGDQLEHESFADAWRWLENRRLVTPTDVVEVWRMHRLVRGHLRAEFMIQQITDWFSDLILEQRRPLAAQATSVSTWATLALAGLCSDDSALSNEVRFDVGFAVGRWNACHRSISIACIHYERCLSIASEVLQPTQNMQTMEIVARNELAGIAHRQGNSQRALEMFQTNLKAFKAKPVYDGQNEAICLSKIGECYRDLQMIGYAVKSFKQAFEICKLRLKHEPNDEWALQHQCHNRDQLADILQQAGQNEMALELHLKNQRVMERLGLNLTRSMAITRSKIAMLKGPAKGATELRQHAEIHRNLLGADPESTERVRDYVLGLFRLARLAFAEFRLADGIRFYKDGLIRLQGIAERDDSNAILKYDLIDYWQEIARHDTENQDLWLSKALEYLTTELAKGLSVSPARSTHWSANFKNVISLELKRRQHLLEQK